MVQLSMGSEYQIGKGAILMSTTDRTGRITHCNEEFISDSGYSRDELIGEPHSIVRHPDMPAAAFKDMWRRIGAGKCWQGLVKNRRKDGAFYWVQANVTPILRDGKPVGYMSVRVAPAIDDVKAAEQLYAKLNSTSGADLRRTASKSRQPLGYWVVALVYMLALVGVAMFPVDGMLAKFMQAGILLGMTVFAACIVRCKLDMPISKAMALASSLARCELTPELLPISHSNKPLAILTHSLYFAHANMRAVISDAMCEVHQLEASANRITNEASEVALRTVQQSTELQDCASTVALLTETISAAAGSTMSVRDECLEVAKLAACGVETMQRSKKFFERIQANSATMSGIVATIDGIAFQTNILALNASVEAARAGELGRGFAVVAQEVRELALRSASAAKEVKSLIGASGDEIEHGAKSIEDAQEQVKRLAGAIQHVTTLTDGIASTSELQREEIQSINRNLCDLDALTRRHTELVKSSKSSALKLQRNWGVLQRTLQVFA